MAVTLRPPKQPHVLTVGATKVGVILSDVYAGIETIVGVDKISPTNRPDTSSSAADLLKSGQALRIRIRYVAGTKARTADVLCDVDKAKTAVSELVGKTYRGGAIRSAYFARRARYS